MESPCASVGGMAELTLERERPQESVLWAKAAAVMLCARTISRRAACRKPHGKTRCLAAPGERSRTALSAGSLSDSGSDQIPSPAHVWAPVRRRRRVRRKPKLRLRWLIRASTPTLQHVPPHVLPPATRNTTTAPGRRRPLSSVAATDNPHQLSPKANRRQLRILQGQVAKGCPVTDLWHEGGWSKFDPRDHRWEAEAPLVCCADVSDQEVSSHL